MGMWSEFKEFAVRGNVVDLAVGVIIGGAFGKIVTSLVNDVVMPPVGLLVGNVDFSELAIVLREKTGEAEAVQISYGLFLNTAIHFVIIALAVFLLICQINRLKRVEKPAPPNTKPCPYCVSLIDLKASRCPNCTSELSAAGPEG